MSTHAGNISVLAALDGILAQLSEALLLGLSEDPVWSTFLESLRKAVAADYASLVFRPFQEGEKQNQVIHLYAGTPSPPEVSQHYRETLSHIDPVPYRAMEEGAVYSLERLLCASVPEFDAYVHQLLIPSGMNIMRMMRVCEMGGVSAWLTISRGSEEFLPEIDSLLQRLAPLLRAALRSHVIWEQDRIKASVAKEAVRRLNFAWITLDARGTILDHDKQGAQILAESQLLRKGRDGRLGACHAELDRAVQKAIVAMNAQSDARPRAMVLSREPWLDMLLVSPPYGAIKTRTGTAPAMIAYLHADAWSSEDRQEQLLQIFDLTPSEARLALGLARGLSLAEAADSLALTLETVRTYSKRIYAKTGARGQADLVRFIHRSVLAIV